MPDRDEAGRFAPGNRLWEARSTCGPNPKFETPDQLWAVCCEYFEWVHDNPLLEAKGYAFQGVVTQDSLPKMRAMTITAMCLFIGISRSTWDEWRKSRPDLSDVITQAEAIIYTQKFEGAAADLLNSNIIARELGLADKQEHTGKDGGPIQTETSATEVARRLAFLLAQGVEEMNNG